MTEEPYGFVSRGESDAQEGGGGTAFQTGDAPKSNVDVSVARADLAVAESDESRLTAWIGYPTLTAPFDGVIVARNANTGDFVLPATGDPTRESSAPRHLDFKRLADLRGRPSRHCPSLCRHFRTGGQLRPYRDEGERARPGVPRRRLPATVTRTSWALNIKSRTLRAEIDLANPDSQLLPGMYAYGRVTIECTGVRAVPVDALVHSGDQTFCWLYKNGKAVRTEVDTGVSDDEWIEVTNHRRPVSREAPSNKVPWTRIDGSEPVILGDLSILADGAPVREATAIVKTKELTQN